MEGKGVFPAAVENAAHAKARARLRDVGTQTGSFPARPFLRHREHNGQPTASILAVPGNGWAIG